MKAAFCPIFVFSVVVTMGGALLIAAWTDGTATIVGFLLLGLACLAMELFLAMRLEKNS